MVTESTAGPSSPSRASGRQRLALLIILVVAGAGRLILALVLYPGVGFAGDINAFIQWAHGFTLRGPSAFYAGDSSANYPPLSILMLGGLDKLSGPATAVLGGSAAHSLVVLIKIPSVLADVVTTGVVYLLGRDLRGPGAGLVGAVLFAVIPPVWYVSALWGQIDSVLIMFSAIALLLLCRRHLALAALAAACALMIKPQGVLVVLIVVVVAVAELAGRDPSGRRRGVRLLPILGIPAVLGVALLTFFDYRSLAGSELQGIPVVGDLAGFYAQSVSTGKLFPVLTANAFNGWALVGHPPLSSTIGTGRSVWLLDASTYDGLSWSLIGLMALLIAVVLVIAGLAVRRDPVAILFGYTVLSYAFFAFPTRVHERYLLPTFASAAALAGVGIVRIVVYLIAGLLNLVNLHAVLAAPLGVVTRVSMARAIPGFQLGGGGFPPGGSGGGGGPGGGGSAAGSTQAGDIALPWASQARAESVVQVVSIAQSSIGVVLVIGWLVFSAVSLRRRIRA